MKCPNCGAENPDYAFYCGKCSATIREAEQETRAAEPSSETVPITQMEPLVRSSIARLLMKIAGVALAFFGVIFAAIAIYAMSGGNVVFTINDKVYGPKEGGPIFLVIGVVMFLVGYGILFLARRVRRATPVVS
jgi:uncharacterized membrane protein